MKVCVRLILSVLVIITNVTCENPNNVCKRILDYSTKSTNPNCWYNPDVSANASTLVLSHGYPLEIYEAITEDSYILQVFRIPPKRKHSKGIVFLQHPSAGSCVNWIDLGNISLAFLLVNEGYDVWMGNFRGTIYSDKHVYLDTSSNEYWNHSFHEMGLYDLPAQIDLVRKHTNRKDKIYYIGHSMGATTAFVYASLRPQHATKNVKLFLCWTPVAYMKYTSALIVIATPLTPYLMIFLEAIHQLSFIPHYGIIHKIIIYLCSEIPWTMELCFLALESYSGYTPNYFLPERLPLLAAQNFAGISIKAFAHYGHIYNSGGRFQFYDYGIIKNEYYYHSKKPPLYPIENIKIPMCFMYGNKDILADEKDVLDLYNKLPAEARHCIKKIDGFGHLDFQYGKDVEKMVFSHTISTLKEYRDSNT